MAMENPYSYIRTDFKNNMQLVEKTDRWLRYAVDFLTAYRTRYEENNTVRGDYLQPSGVSGAPLAILVHGMGDLNAVPCRLLARDLVKKGIACFVLYLVFYSSRLPREIKERLPELTPEEWFEIYRISVINVRQVIDWAGSRPEIDSGRVAVMGISFGRFINTIAMGTDPRIKAGIFVVTGGSYESPAWIRGRRDGRQPAEDTDACDRY